MAADTVGHTASLMLPAVHGLPVLSVVCCLFGVCVWRVWCVCEHACMYACFCSGVSGQFPSSGADEGLYMVLSVLTFSYLLRSHGQSSQHSDVLVVF